MIKALKKKFTQIAILSIGSVLFLVLFALNGANFWQVTSRIEFEAKHLIEIEHLSDDDDEDDLIDIEIKDKVLRKQPSQWWNVFEIFNNNKDVKVGNFYWELLDTNGQVVDSGQNGYLFPKENNTSIHSQVAIIPKDKTGFYQNFYIVPIERDNLSGRLFIDISREFDNVKRLALMSVLLYLITLVIIYFVLTKVSPKAVKPFEDNLNRQREFINNASHEIKTPLAVLSANNDLIDMLTDQKKFTESNRRQIRRLNQLIEQMLLLARYDEGRQSIEIVAIDLLKILEGQIADASLMTDSINIHTNLPEHLIVNSDFNAVQTIIQVLLENAVNYHSPNTQITVEWMSTTKTLVISNECEPLEQEQVNQIFDRFYRVDSARSSETGGSGMGLSIAKMAAQAINAQLTAKLITPTRIGFYLTFK